MVAPQEADHVSFGRRSPLRLTAVGARGRLRSPFASGAASERRAHPVVGKVVGDCGPGTVRPVSGTLIATDPLTALGGGLGSGCRTSTPLDSRKPART